ncbi:TPA: hypothetical protein ACJKI5_002152 [Escherichia coli]|uniref:hypothetical protein n=1 Tax=Escherichia coli TaxID=562 RepID=UPI000D035053|nr:hypothetical protein [Escherichia coli]EFB4449282.1 hypothetical protein [Escherichia coli]EFO0555960.1 hypothetical protein [Escherichia coli]EHD1861842.1 hypothetical protein [Escherichia coli]EHI0929763.1 hypothetical protein [Escherichia coli]EHW5482840.1 hypothetical protein [Escherichia coli]
MATNNNIYEAVLNVIGVADKMTKNNASQLTDAQKLVLKNLSGAMKSWKGITFGMRDITANDKPTESKTA